MIGSAQKSEEPMEMREFYRVVTWNLSCDEIGIN
jgi:hypothetical protein